MTEAAPSGGVAARSDAKDGSATATIAARPEASETATAPTGSDFAELAKRINDAGLLERRPGYYVARLSIVGLLYVGGWVTFFLMGDTWWQLTVAAFLAVIFAQLALVAHDLAHRQVFRKRRISEISGRIAGNLGVGMSYGWWMDKHTRHHANPNHEELDPDVSPELLIWSERQARNSSGIAKFIGRRQAFLFFPLLTLEGFNLHVASVRGLFRPNLRGRAWEAVTLFAHFAFYLAAVFTVLPVGKAIVFLLVNQALFGVYLGCTFAPNHKGMPTLTKEDELDFLRKQVLTSRNIKGGVAIDIALGGLNYQIEHHLFPNMPSPNLPKAKKIVRDYCAELKVPYQETGLIESYAIALKHMHHVGAPIRAAAKG
ncbi:fatty acid desaturase family protein [Actinoalloteichus hymeniacidonis]|uniref:Fatty acid desaturase n=1 Tax=Actinoalloteichus hymeniacidonis TaxID=340345 RepID=A0AAC9N107_9PSEU|nr:acyl-CoA desaturase [Actinoalloteichus hymeniacidonis]AOS66149.1 fatty acid desaturase [Actinoalloteichus hymeniacidonis]MBB5905748.1 fatty acid desaturase [Actinoalloteichus hymeniacidonis]